MEQSSDPTEPEWASRLLKIPEWAEIVGEDRATVHRKIKARIYPQPIHIVSSSRLPGWECWATLKKLMAERRDGSQ